MQLLVAGSQLGEIKEYPPTSLNSVYYIHLERKSSIYDSNISHHQYRTILLIKLSQSVKSSEATLQAGGSYVMQHVDLFLTSSSCPSLHVHVTLASSESRL